MTVRSDKPPAYMDKNWGSYDQTDWVEYQYEIFIEALAQLRFFQETIPEFLERKSQTNEETVLVDLFGPGPIIRSLFSFIKNKLTAFALTYNDFRTGEQKRKDKENNLEIIPGDFLKSRKTLFDKLKGKKITAFFSRALKGWDHLPNPNFSQRNADYWITILAEIYQNLDHDGLLLMELPIDPDNATFLNRIKEIKQNNPDIDIGLEEMRVRVYIALYKMKDSPDTLRIS